MPSTSQLTQNSRSMNGLNTINANAVFTDTLEVNTLTIDTAGTVPTRPNGDNTTNIANTQFVTNAVTTAGANYVDLTSTQTVTGAKTFSNANTVISGALRNTTLDPSTSSQNTFRDTNQVAGICNIANNTNRTGAININTGSASTAPVNISTASSTGTVVTIGSTSGGTTTLNCGTLNLSGTAFSRLGAGMTGGTITVGGGAGSATTINIGSTQTNVTSAINIGTVVTGNAPITIGSTASTTQTATHNAITTFSKIPSCAVVPTTADHLCNKSYVDSVSGVNLGDYNVWTNENDFTNIVKIKDPTVSSTAGIDFFSSITPGIVMNGAPGATNANTGVNLNTNTLTVPINNNQSLVRVRIPMNIAGFGAPIIYFGQVDLIFNSITAITILKNGSFYKTVSVFDLLNFTGTTKTWTGWSQKGENARAYLGDVQFELPITTANTSVDTYTIGITLDISVNASASLYIGVQFLCTGNSNFTTTHATTTTGTTYISTDPPSFFPYQLNFGNNGNYIIGTGDTYIKTIEGGRLNIETGSSIEVLSLANFNTVLPQSTLTPLNNADLATKLYIDNAISQAITALTPATNPIGTIIMRASSTVPAGYLYCDGTTYNTTAYAGLWSVIFYTYGGSGSNFKVPDYRGCFIRGFGSQTVGGVTYTAPALGTVQQDSVLALSTLTNQGYWNIDSGGGGTSRQVKSRVRISTDPVDSGAFGAGIDGSFPRQNTTENRPINQSVYYYIKF